MPGVERLSVAEAAKAAKEARKLGIPAIAVFPHIDGAKMDASGSAAADPDGLVARAVKAMKDAEKEGKGAVALDGKLIDLASIRQAEVLVKKAKQIATG